MTDLRIRYKRLRNDKGHYLHKRNIIEINKFLQQTDTIETLYHELTHYVIFKTLEQLVSESNIKKAERLCQKLGKICKNEVKAFFKSLPKL